MDCSCRHAVQTFDDIMDFELGHDEYISDSVETPLYWSQKPEFATKVSNAYRLLFFAVQ